jgi:DNA polymerase-3 subunit gamma/tau
MTAYLALARRWRPQHFDDFVGQEAVVSALRHALDSGRIHHAFLFTGTRGVGKTTLARLLAKCLNCEKGISSNPCGTCSACTSIATGNFVDLMEVDAASRTRVDETRDLLDNVQYAPTVGRYKVYLIDEVHMLSTHSFNALLKTLEEPPEHVKFLLATTDPQKLPVTVLSRCLQFNLRRLDIPLIQGRLQQIMTAEHIPAEASALQVLSRAADGSLRDALSLLDQAIVHGNGEVRRDAVLAMLGRSGEDAVMTLVAALVAQDAPQVFAMVDEHLARGLDAAGLLDLLIEGIHRLSLAQFIRVDEIATDAEDLQQLAALQAQISPLMLQAWYFLLLSARRDFSLYPDPRMALEMALLRVLSFAGAANRPQPPPQVFTKPKAMSEHVVEASYQSVVSAGDSVREPLSESAPGETALDERPEEFSIAVMPPETHDWRSLVEVLELSPIVREYLRHSQALKCDATLVDIVVEATYLPHLIKAKEALSESLLRHFGQKPQLRLQELGRDAGIESLVAEERAQAVQRMSDAQVRVAADDCVQKFVKVLNAELESVTFRTADPSHP